MITKDRMHAGRSTVGDRKMNKSYRIITDASADIDPVLAQEKRIIFIPMTYLLDGEEFVCSGPGNEGSVRDFYEALRKGGKPSTSQISPQVYEDFFEMFACHGEDILYISLSGGLSGTLQSATLAAMELRERYPDSEIICVDSRSATIGMGLLLEAAANNRDRGMSLHENVRWLKEHRLEIQHWFMVDNLGFLKRGGRISAATAMVGTLLNIHPLLKIEADGTLINFEKCRGSKAGIARLVQLFDETAPKDVDQHVYVVHADNPEAAEKLRREILSVRQRASVSVVQLCPVIGTHVGPDMCAIAHWGRPESARTAKP